MWKQLSGTPYHRKASLVALVVIDSIKLVVDSEWVYWLTTRELNKDATYSYLPSTVEARYCFLAISSHFGRILCRLLGGGLSRLQERLLWIAADIIYRNNNREYWQAVKFIKSIGVCLPPWLSCQIYGQRKSRFVRENIQRRPNESCRQGANPPPIAWFDCSTMNSMESTKLKLSKPKNVRKILPYHSSWGTFQYLHAPVFCFPRSRGKVEANWAPTTSGRVQWVKPVCQCR